jgi:hypothetical protein
VPAEIAGTATYQRLRAIKAAADLDANILANHPPSDAVMGR